MGVARLYIHTFARWKILYKLEIALDPIYQRILGLCSQFIYAFFDLRSKTGLKYTEQ